MNTKQLIALSALALAAGAASAQTVPAEAWVGAPIATTGSALSRTAPPRAARPRCFLSLIHI